MSKPTLGGMILAARKDLNLTRPELAEKLDITASYLYELESDRKVPGLRLLRRIAEATGKDLTVRLNGGDP